jgi:uncharacterized membrane protein
MELPKHGKKMSTRRVLYFFFSLGLFFVGLVALVGSLVAFTNQNAQKYFTVSRDLDKWILLSLTLCVFWLSFYCLRKCFTYLVYLEEKFLWVTKVKNFSAIDLVFYQGDKDRPVLQFYSGKRTILILDSAFHGYEFTLNLIDALIEKRGDRLKIQTLESMLEETANKQKRNAS